ncbi:MAG: hypothetical protein HYZ23_07345 [Chloroflexi bacterium]|nr:hypothetical protein [Chloroflexota bacterium]
MKTKKFHPVLFIAILIAASVACSIFVGGPEYPTQSVPVSADEVQTMHSQIEQAFTTGAESGIVTLQITETQLTSLIALKMQEQADPPFTDPQVLLRNGQMQIFGKIKSGSFNANIAITANIGIDETTGMPKVEVTSVDLGPLPAPDGLNAAINAIIAEAFTGTLGPVATGFRLESITIADGVMTMTGRIK